ncbi:SCO4225 family membrane protein [Streptosporangium sp. NPDC002721]|uniref:SCO4225 family membrane protein n=1 Tax=Streptosporangium sp. NPDC002721 TaxID=3366188 RepID=UPI0036AEA1EE
MRSTRGLARLASRYRRGTLALVIGGIYALLVIAAYVFAEIGMRQPNNQGLSAVLLILVTLPLSWLVMMIPGEVLPSGVHLLSLVVAGLVQASFLWWLLRGPRVDVPSTREE